MDSGFMDILGFLESLQEATQKTKENPEKDESAPLVTAIAKARANCSPGLSLLLRSLQLLREPSDETKVPLMWFEDYDASQILMGGILDAFIEGLGRFPGLATPAIRCATLDIISQLAPHLNDYLGPDIRVYIRYALLTAKVLGRDTDDLAKARMQIDQTTGLDWESMPEDESRIKSQERKRTIKTAWVYNGDIFTEAVLELASLEGCHTENFTMNFVRTCHESYGEGRGTKIFSPRINDTEWTAAQTGDVSQRRPVWKRMVLNLQKEAWQSLEAGSRH